MEDKLYPFLKYYNNSPQWVKSIFGRLYGLLPLSVRYGRVYLKYSKLLEGSQWWPKERLEEYQWLKLEALLRHAYENIPYYRKIFDERGIKPKDIQNFDDFRKLPFLTKKIVRDNLENLIAKNYPKSRLLYMTTGGSTGIPLGLYYEKGVARSKELAFMTAQWGRVGYKIGDKLALLRGNVVKRANNRKFWEYEPIKNRLILSSYHMTDENLPLYIEQIRKFRPKFLHVYPSAITILAKFMRMNNIEPFPTTKAVLCASETLYPSQRELLEQVFKCRIFDFYGAAETVAMAGECEKSDYYHIFPEYSYVELIRNDGQPVTEEGAIGEIVGTTFDNDVMPLIRYRTMDIAIYTKEKCRCGRNYPLLKRIEGRTQDFIISDNNKLISIAAINMHSDVFDNIKQFQFYQDKKCEVIFNIVRRDSYTERDTRYIRKELLKKLGNDVDLQVRFVNEIPRTKSGKYRFLIQRFPIDFVDSGRYEGVIC